MAFRQSIRTFIYAPLVHSLLKNLKGEIPKRARREFLPNKEVYKRLKELSGCAFSMDEVASWEKWVRQQLRASSAAKDY